MRVLLLTADYPPSVWSGIGFAVERQAQALASIGVCVTVLVDPAHNASDRPAVCCGEDNVSVYVLERHRFPVDPAEFDLVHLHSLSLSELALELCGRYRLPLVYTAHSLICRELALLPRTALWRTVQKHVMRASEHVVFLNRAEWSDAVEMGLVESERSCVIPNGIMVSGHRQFNNDDVVEQVRQLGIEPEVDEDVLLFAGRFTQRKGIHLIAQMMSTILANERCRFVLAGGHGDDEGLQIVDAIQQEHSIPRCIVLEWVPRQKIDALLQYASVTIVPSLYEPFGLIALESMVAGTPVLASAVGGLAEIITPNSGGVLLDTHDPHVWSQSALNLLAAPSELAELAAKGPPYVAAHFDARQLALQLCEQAYKYTPINKKVDSMRVSEEVPKEAHVTA